MTQPPPSVPAGATAPRHTHPVTPLVQGARVGPFALILGVGFVGQNVGGFGLAAIALAAVMVTVVLVAIVAAISYLAWQRLTFWFDDQGDFRMASGILTRRERRLQLSRLQGVEVVQPLMARIFGMCQVTIEVAGTGDSRAMVQYLTLPEGNELRNSVIARAAGLHPDTGEAPQRPLVTVPGKDLFVSLLLRGSTVVLLGLTLLIVFTTLAAAGPAGLLWLIIGGVPIIIVAAEFINNYGFTVAQSPDGLRTRAGLLQVQAQTIPPGRVQAVEFVQSWLWRRKDWVRVRITVAGAGGSDDQNQSGGTFQQMLLPVAPYDVALSVVNEILPGVDARSIPLAPAPSQAHKRAWIQFHRLGVGWDDRVFVTRRGRFVQYLAVAPHARTQSVRVTQGPWERALGLASMHLDSPPGPVRVVAMYRAAAEARRIADEQNARATRALATDPAARWMQGPK